MNPPVYLINLDASADRLGLARRALGDSGFTITRVSAIDGASLPPEASHYDAAENRRRYLAPLASTEIACVLSHRKAWQEFLAQARDAAIFLEDDARPLAGAQTVGDFVLRTCAGPSPVLCKLNRVGAAATPAAAPAARRALVPPTSLCAYAANRAAAQALLAFTERFHEPVDVALQRWWDHRVRVLLSSPPLFFEDRGPGYASTIRRTPAPPHEGRLLRELRRPIFQACRLVRATREVLLRGYV